jgi:hypothetical protein
MWCISQTSDFVAYYGCKRRSIALCSDIGPRLRCSKQAWRGRPRNTRHGYAGQCNEKRSNIIDYRFRRLRARVDHYGKHRRRQGGFQELARRAVLIVVGATGTISEVVNGFGRAGFP